MKFVEPKCAARIIWKPWSTARTLLLIFALWFLAALPSLASAQTAHSVILTWTDTLNPATGTTYNVKRATGLCTGTPTFTTLATALTTKTFTDTTVTPGNYCYEVTATVNGVESSPSNTVNPAVPAFPPAGLAFTVN
jgi:hypothetical protein